MNAPVAIVAQEIPSAAPRRTARAKFESPTPISTKSARRIRPASPSPKRTARRTRATAQRLMFPKLNAPHQCANYMFLWGSLSKPPARCGRRTSTRKVNGFGPPARSIR
jgi:hypothetical protein